MADIDWRPDIMIGEDLMAAPAPDCAYEWRSLRELRDEALSARGTALAADLWAAYHKKLTELEEQRDALRAVNGERAKEFGERVGRLRGVTIESAGADDFGHLALCLIVDGTHFWTRPVKDAEKGYKAIRDAISAFRRKDHRHRNWLSREGLWRRTVTWDGYDQVRFGENEHGSRQWHMR